MKKLTSAALLIVGTILASQSAKASITANDLYMGFQNSAGGATNNYIVDLGSASTFTSGVNDLSSDFSLADFNNLLGASTSMYVGVVGGSNAGNPSDIFLTQLRSGAGAPTSPGSSVGLMLTRSQDNVAYSDLTALNGPASGTGVLDNSLSWQTYVENQPQSQTSGTYWSDAGLNPDSAVDTSDILYEDLWETSSGSFSGSQPFTYLGYFTVDFTGANPDVTFQAVPEPGTALIAGISGLSLLILRRRFGKNA